VVIAVVAGVATTLLVFWFEWFRDRRGSRQSSSPNDRHLKHMLDRRRAVGASVAIALMTVISAPQAAQASGSQGYFGVHWQANAGYYVCTDGTGHIGNMGNGVLYLNTSTTARYNGCYGQFTRPATWIYVKEDLYFNNGSSGFTVCNIGPWINNSSSSYYVGIGWSPSPLPCGAGTYYVQGWHDVWDPAIGYTGGGAVTPSIFAS
jgi:hypothetical protein